MNTVYRLIWNATLALWQVTSELASASGKGSGGRSARALRRLLLATGTLLAAPAFAAPAPAELPTGGQVVAGSASIGTSGARMDIDQSTQRAAINWQTFNIGSQAHVNFNQPTGGATLNRVLDTNASQIYGKLTSTGQVFLVNPNGVLFAPGTQVDVGGLVASTLNISNADFMTGNLKFEGSSSNAIINQGNIKTGAGGSVAFIAAKIINDGTIEAQQGNVLMGAGSKVTLDLGGPVKLQVENDTLETLIQNGGAIKADGGHVLLTSQAAATLASSVINNTGLIEAQTLATGEKGEIILFAHGGIANIAGRLDASAPNGGDGGFIETSGSKVVNSPDLWVTTLASFGNTGTWLIDPVTYTVAASGGDETGAALAGRLAGTNIQLQADNTITVNDAVSWSANKLTLTSGGNINVNATLTATGSASLAFEYGQSSADGSSGTYTVVNGAKINIPEGAAFTWKKGSAGATKNLVLDNGLMRFGNGTENSFTADGQLKQPFYFDDVAPRNDWYKLTYSSYPLDIAVASGGDGTNSWNYNGEVLTTNDSSRNNTYAPALSNKSLEISGYKEGVGTVVASNTVTFTSTQTLKVENAYRLDAGVNYLKTDTTITNTSGSALSNLRLWVGTRDDYVAESDSNYKFKGNLGSTGFELITDQNQQAKAVKISESDDGVTGAAILFYSTSAGADTVVDECCRFSYVTNKDPRTSLITTPQEDGSYALFMRLDDLAPAQSGGMTWYYAAAPASQINSVVTSVAESAGVASAPAPAPAPAPATQPSIPVTTAIQLAQILPTEIFTTVPTYFSSTPSPTARPPVSVVTRQLGTLPVIGLSGGLAFVEVTPPTGGAGGTGGSGTSGATGAPSSFELPSDLAEEPFGFMRVFVVAGGLNLSNDAAVQAAEDADRRRRDRDNSSNVQ